jgi:hypothetical protein
VASPGEISSEELEPWRTYPARGAACVGEWGVAVVGPSSVAVHHAQSVGLERTDCFTRLESDRAAANLGWRFVILTRLQTEVERAHLLKALRHILPIDHLPEGRDPVAFFVLNCKDRVRRTVDDYIAYRTNAKPIT